MGQKVLEIKMRQNGRARIYKLPSAAVERIMNEEPERAGELLYETFKNVKAQEDRVSDVMWLDQIMSWTPPGEKGGLTIKQMAPYMRLAEKVARLPDDKEIKIRLSDYEVGLLHARMTDDEFKMQALIPAFAGFVTDFLAATGKQFDTLEVDEDEVSDDDFIVEE